VRQVGYLQELSNLVFAVYGTTKRRSRRTSMQEKSVYFFDSV